MTFIQEGRLAEFEATDPWKIAGDLVDTFEAALGELWDKSRLEVNAMTPSNTKFPAPDLIALRSKVDAYGGPIDKINLDSTTFRDGETYSCEATIWIEGGQTSEVWLYLYAPQRNEIETLGYSIKRSVEVLARRKRWAGVVLRFGAITHHTTAGERPTPTRAPRLQARRASVGARRWFIHHRDAIIVGLGCSLAASFIVIMLQALWPLS